MHGVCELPRFYFQVVENGVEGPIDDEGMDYPTLQAAEDDAAAVTARMMAGTVSIPTTIVVSILNEKREALARVTVALSKDSSN
jgi:hypothetical protein